MTRGVRFGAWTLAAVMAAPAAGDVRAEGPVDLPSAFSRAFEGVEACAALRDVAPGAQTAVSDKTQCERRLPPCATLELPATVIALDRGVVPDANSPVKRNPPMEGDPADGVTLRDAFRRQTGWVFEEVARRIGPEAFTRSLAAMRYGDVENDGRIERINRDGDAQGVKLSAVEQVDFLAKMRRGELPTSAESQARTVEVAATERIGDATVAWKSGSCDGVAWAVGWLDRSQRSVIFATSMTGQNRSTDEAVARTKRLMGELNLLPPAK